MIKKPRWKNGLGVVAAVSLLAISVQAQDTNAPTVLKPTVVTGSYIPTAETVGAAPVDIISSTAITRAGQQDVLATLVKLDPSFSGSANLGQVANNYTIFGGALPAGEANVAIRNLQTLVLLDGRRLPNSALSAGQAVDLNTIPISVIERVDILKDGASALYGSDAIGGVVNVITKNNWSGTEISGRVGFPTRSDSNDLMEYRASVISGATAENYKFFVGAQYYHMDPLLTKDRPTASASIQDLLNKGILPPSYFSPSYPGRVQDNNGSYILAGSSLAEGTTANGYRYIPGLVTPPIIPGFVAANRSLAVTEYNAAAHAALGYYPYVPLGLTPLGQQLDSLTDASGQPLVAGLYPALNTTEFGTHSILQQDRRNFFANVEHDLYDKNLQFFGSFLYANNLSQAELAPSPVVSLPLYNITIPANNPYNPFGVGLGADVAGGGAPRVRSRFEDSGNRIFDAQSDTYHFVGGLKGEISPRYDWEGAYTYNRADQTYFTHNAINGTALNRANAGILTDANGNALPAYNMFALPGFNSTNAASTVDGIKTTLFNSGISELWSVDGHVHGQPFDLPAGPFDLVVGSAYVYESLNLSVDGLTQLGLVPGLNQAFPFPGGVRDRAAVFAEARIPVFSEQKNYPGLYSVDITAAGRYERIWPGGDSAVPKVGLRWSPFDKESALSMMTFRGGYSEGFIAPAIYNLFGPDSVSNPTISLPGGPGQVQTQTRSNPNLPPSESQNWNVGLVYSPKQIEGLTVSVDCYNVKQNQVVISDPVVAANSLNAVGVNSPWAPGFTFADGTHLTTTAPNQVTVDNWGNLLLTNTATAKLKTDGIDLSASYKRPIENAGTWTVFGNANLIMNYELQSSPAKPFYHYEGLTTWQFGTAQGTIPDYRLNFGLTWEFHDFTTTLLAHYIPSVTDLGFLHPEVGLDQQGFTSDTKAFNVPAYYTLDLQVSYFFGPKYGRFVNGTRLAVGVNNITDEDTPLIASAIEDNTDKSVYDLMGRFIYFEISKSF